MKKILLSLLLLSVILTPVGAQSRKAASLKLSPQRTLLVKNEAEPSFSKQTAPKGRSLVSSKSFKMRAIGNPIKLNANETSILYQCVYASKQGTSKWASTYIFDSANKKVTIKNMMDGVLGIPTEDVVGKYENNEITLNCKDFSKDSANYVFLGHAEGIDAFLGAGTLETKGSSTYVNLENDLKLNVSSDFSTISTTKVVCIVMSDPDYGTYNGFTARNGLTWSKVPEGAASTINAHSFDFGTIYYSQKGIANLVISSTGNKDVKYNVMLNDSHFSIADSMKSRTIASLDSVVIPISFSPLAVGDYSGKATITAGDSVYTVSLTGKAIEMVKDFSDIIVKGDSKLLTWDNTSAYPWTLENKIAQAGNLGTTETASTLKATIKSDKAIRMTFDFNLKTGYQDSLLFVVDKDTAFTYIYKLNDTYSYVIPAGTHNLEWTFLKSFWKKADVAKLFNMKLEEVNDWEGLSPDNSVSNISATNWANYNNIARPTGKSAELTFKLSLAQKSAISFDCKAAPNKPLKVLVDGKEAMTTEKADTTFFYNFTTIGEHTVKCVCSGDESRVGVSEVYLTKGAYCEITRSYVLNGQSYYDDNGEFSATDGVKVSYPVKVTYSSTGKVKFYELLTKGKCTHLNPVIGYMKDNKITVKANSNYDNKGFIYGYDDQTYENPAYVGNLFWLLAGTLAENDTRNLVDEFSMAVGKDSIQLIPDTGIGVLLTTGGDDEGMSIFLKPGFTLTSAVDGYSLISETDTLDFGKAYAQTSQITKMLNVLNNGKQTDFSAEIIDGDGAFAFAPKSGTFKAMETKSFDITFTPQKAGNCTAKLVISSEGKDVSIVLKADVEDKPDFSAIVKEGGEHITWNTSADYPWYVKDGVAYSGNTGHNSTVSTLTANVTIPEGYVARISSDAAIDVEPQADAFSVNVNSNVVMRYYQRDDHANFCYIMDAGNYKINFSEIKDGAQSIAPTKDICSLSNVRLVLQQKAADCAFVWNPAPRFNELVPVKEKATTNIWVVNKGTNALKINSVSADYPFSVEGYEKSIAVGDTALLTLAINANKADTYNGKVVLHTTAGDLNFDAYAVADYVHYLGKYEIVSPLVPVCTYYSSIGIYPIYTQALFDASEMEALKGLKITDMTFFSAYVPTVDYGAKDVVWQVGTTKATDLTEDKPSGLTTVHSGEQVDIDNYEQTVKFDQPYQYDGDNFMFAMLQNDKESYPFNTSYRASGEHKAGLPIVGVWIKTFGLQTVKFGPYVRLRYIPVADGLQNNQNTDKQVVSVKYFTTNGMQVSNLQQGVNIVVTTYSDGSVTSEKKFVNK